MKDQLTEIIDNLKDLVSNQEKMGIPTGGIREAISQLEDLKSQL